MSSTVYGGYKDLKPVRNRRFDEQGGLCYYCKRPMIRGPLDVTGKKQPNLLCTLEHLIDRLNPSRWDENHNSEKRYVAACAQCNHGRSAWNTKHAPKDLIMMLSHKPRNMTAKDLILGYYATREYVEPPPFVPQWKD
jgi:5-methylcytosine-specific restriction endonuclease McrA